MTSVTKSLAGLEDLALGRGLVVQDRGGVPYILHRIDVVPSFDTVEELDTLTTFTRARVGLVNYVKNGETWEVDPIPLSALGAGLGAAASRGVTGLGNLIALGFGGIGGPGLANLAGDGIGLKASYVTSIAAGGPADEPAVVLTLPGTTSDAARIAITLTNVALWFQKVGFAWTKAVVNGANVEFNQVKATSVRADSVGTPKE